MNGTEFWDAAYRNHAPVLMGVLRRYVPETSIAQDLLHEVFITAINKHDSFSGSGTFEGWLHRITVNTALMYLRTEKSKKKSAEAVLSVMDDDESSVERADDARTIIETADFSGEELLAAIDRLPDHHKVVFNMYVMDDFSHKQIGTELHISPGTSKSHLARARKKIQQYLYEEAVNKKDKKDKKWASAFLLFPSNTHFIDRLYRSRMSDFTIPPAGDTGFLSAALENHAASMVSATSQEVALTSQMAASAVPQAVPTATFWGSKLSYAVMCCGTAAITSSVCWVSMSEDSPLNQDNKNISVVDTTMHSPNIVIPDETTFDAATHDALMIPDAIPEIVLTEIEQAESQHLYMETNSSPSDNEVSAEKSTVFQPRQTVQPHQNGLPKTSTSNNTQPTVNSATESLDPVVVKKQIIEHKTVVIRDTIVIQE